MAPNPSSRHRADVDRLRSSPKQCGRLGDSALHHKEISPLVRSRIVADPAYYLIRVAIPPQEFARIAKASRER